MTAPDDDGPAPEELAALRARHAGRAYHGWAHVEALLGLLGEAAGAVRDPAAVRLAILFHDAVYDPRRTDNERSSAALLRARMAGRVAPARLDAAEAMVLATERHELPDGLPDAVASDARHFLDMDLAILGAPEDAFDAYDRAIRAEYAHVPEATFRAGRAAVLRGLRARAPIFLTPLFRARFEAPARRNLDRVIAGLEAG